MANPRKRHARKRVRRQKMTENWGIAADPRQWRHPIDPETPAPEKKAAPAPAVPKKKAKTAKAKPKGE